MLELVFSSKASIFGFCSMFCSTDGVALKRKGFGSIVFSCQKRKKKLHLNKILTHENNEYLIHPTSHRNMKYKFQRKRLMKYKSVVLHTKTSIVTQITGFGYQKQQLIPTIITDKKNLMLLLGSIPMWLCLPQGEKPPIFSFFFSFWCQFSSHVLSWFSGNS